MRRWIAVVVALVVVVVAWRVLASNRRTAEPPPAEVAVPVEVRAVETKALAATVSAGGTVQATDEVTIFTKITSRVAAVLVKEGDRVRAGQVVVRLEAEELKAQVRQAEAGLAAAEARLHMVQQGARPQERAQVESAVAQAKANYDTAQANYDRMQMLFTVGAISQAQLDAARLQRDVARSQYESAQQQLSLVQAGARPEEIELARAQVAQAQAAVAFTRLQLGNATIAAPISGTVTHRLVDPGDLASAFPGQGALLTVAQIDTVEVSLSVSETDLARVRSGQPAAIRVDTYPGTVFSGTVREVGQAADPRTRTFTVKVVVANAGHVLRPGMFARGEITSVRHPRALVIPRDAVVSENGGDSVFVVVDGKARARRVQLGLVSGPIVEVLSGVTAGENVVVVGQSGLIDGTAVTVR